MPRYEFKCDVCGHREDKVRTVGDRDRSEPCPACEEREEDADRSGPWFGTLKRDAVASMLPHTDMGYQVPILSNGAGINPAQIPEMRTRFPHHEFHPDGRMIFNSHQHRERCLRDIGMYDKN